MVIREYDIVRVVKLLRDDRRIEGAPDVVRPPKVGETGTVVHVHDPTDPLAPLTVESVDSAGNTIWLADFDMGELDFVSRP